MPRRLSRTDAVRSAQVDGLHQLGRLGSPPLPFRPSACAPRATLWGVGTFRRDLTNPAAVLTRAVRERREALVEKVLPSRRSADVGGWSTSEFTSYVAQPPPRVPHLRAGRDAVTRTNAASGVMPVEAILLARAIADTAPQVGGTVNPTLADILDRYLPESLSAFTHSSLRSAKQSAEDLLLAQLRLLYSVVLTVERAEAEHNERDLQVQDGFLRERFASLTPGQLDLGEKPPTQGPIRSLDAQPRGRAKPVPAEGRARLHHEADPVVLLRRERPGPWDLTLRLALPRGLRATLGVVEESTTGATVFTHRSSRRVFAQVRPTGFRAAQVDLRLQVRLAAPRRFIVYADSALTAEPVETVLFIGHDERHQAELATTLTGHPRARLTVIASGHETRDGLVVRNESLVFHDLRAAATGFGYDGVTWLDDHTPVV